MSSTLSTKFATSHYHPPCQSRNTPGRRKTVLIKMAGEYVTQFELEDYLNHFVVHEKHLQSFRNALTCVSSSVSVIHHPGVPERFRFFIVRTRVPVASAMSPTHVRLCASKCGRSCLLVWAVSASRRGMFVALSVGLDMSSVVVILCSFGVKDMS
jgi:hypothetical protein